MPKMGSIFRHPVVGPWRPGVTGLKLTTGSEWGVSLSAGASKTLGPGDTCHMSPSEAGGRALGPGHRGSRTPGGSRWGPPLRRDPRAGTHLTEPRQLPFSFSWLRLGRCTPGGQRRERSETKPYPSLTSLHPPETSVPLGPSSMAALSPGGNLAAVCLTRGRGHLSRRARLEGQEAPGLQESTRRRGAPLVWRGRHSLGPIPEPHPRSSHRHPTP